MQCPGLRLCSTALKLLDFDEPEARTHGAGHVTSPSPALLAAMKLAMLPLASSHSHLAGPRQWCVAGSRPADPIRRSELWEW